MQQSPEVQCCNSTSNRNWARFEVRHLAPKPTVVTTLPESRAQAVTFLNDFSILFSRRTRLPVPVPIPVSGGRRRGRRPDPHTRNFFRAILAGKFKFAAGSDCRRAISLAILSLRFSSSSSLPLSSDRSAIGPETRGSEV